MVGNQFTEYLTWVIYRCVKRSDGPTIPDLHDLRRQGWPPPPNPDESKTAKVWVLNQFVTLCTRFGFPKDWQKGSQPAGRDVTTAFDLFWPVGVTQTLGSEDWSQQIEQIAIGVFQRLKAEAEKLTLTESNRSSPSNDPKAETKKSPKTESDQALPSSDPKTAQQGSPAPRIWNRPLVPKVLTSCPTFKARDEEIQELWKTFKGTHPYFGFVVDPNTSPDSQSFIEEYAIRSMSDWRAMLDFLTRVVIRSDSRGTRRVALSEPDPDVIDRFNQYLTEGRKPNLAHSMLAHLAAPLRTRVLMTTNFDTLHEQAYLQAGIPFKDHPVTKFQGLPSVGTVRANAAIIKLHGSLTGTRADFSLDEAPTTEDKRRMFHFVLGHDPDEVATPERPRWIPSHLLVIGMGANDPRSIQFIKYLLEYQPDFRVFWIAHCNSDVEKIRTRFSEEFDAGRVLATVTDRSDLLLLELYQRITLTLPKGGFSYQYSHDVPPELWKESEGLQMSQSSNLLNKAVEALKLTSAGDYYRVSLRGDARSGVTTVLGAVISKLVRNERKEAIWIDLEEFADVQSLIHNLFHIISLRMGKFQLENAIILTPEFSGRRAELLQEENKKERAPELASLWSDAIRRIIDYLGSDLSEYVVFFNGRNIPGSVAGWDDTPWEADAFEELHMVMSEISKRSITMIYVPYDQDRYNDLGGKLGNEGKAAEGLGVADDSTDGRGLIIEPVPAISAGLKSAREGIEELLANARKTNSRSEQIRLRFLFGLSLLRRARPPSVFLTDPLFRSPGINQGDQVDNDWLRECFAKRWLTELNERTLIWWKPGGNHWMFLDARRRLKSELQRESGGLFKTIDGRSDPVSANSMSARAHYWIARWYFRAFCSTNHGVPLIESMYHFLQAVRNIPQALRETPEPSVPAGENQYRTRLFIRVISDWVKATQMGRASLVFWYDFAAVEAYFGKEPISRIEGSIIEVVGVLKRDGNPLLRRADSIRARLIAELEECRHSLLRETRIPPELIPKRDRDSRSKFESKIMAIPEDCSDAVLGKKTLCAKLRIGTNGSRRHFRFKRGEILDPVRYTDLRDGALELADTQSAQELCRTIATLSEQSYRLLKRAKAMEFHSALVRPSRRRELASMRAKPYWLYVINLSRVVLDLCSFSSPDHLAFEIRTRVSVLGQYAVALARLGRFLQAHRRLNEAHALLLRWSNGGERSLFAMLELRRAEVRLLEAERVRLVWESGDEDLKKWIASEAVGSEELENGPGAAERILRRQVRELYLEGFGAPTTGEALSVTAERLKRHLEQLMVAKLDDAWSSIEGAEALLSGQVRTSIWWGRLCGVKLRFFANFSRAQIGSWELLAFRRRLDLDAELSRWLGLGFANFAGDQFRCSRLTWYFLWARSKWRRSGKIVEAPEAQLISNMVVFPKRDLVKTQYQVDCRHEFLSWIGVRDIESGNLARLQGEVETQLRGMEVDCLENFRTNRINEMEAPVNGGRWWTR